MIEFYPQIKLLHIVLVLASGAIFIVRGGAAVFGARWTYASWLKWSSATLDTFLLTSAAMLATILPRAVAMGMNLPAGVRARDLPGEGPTVGLVVARREPHPPIVDALLRLARGVSEFD